MYMIAFLYSISQPEAKIFLCSQLHFNSLHYSSLISSAQPSHRNLYFRHRRGLQAAPSRAMSNQNWNTNKRGNADDSPDSAFTLGFTQRDETPLYNGRLYLVDTATPYSYQSRL